MTRQHRSARLRCWPGRGEIVIVMRGTLAPAGRERERCNDTSCSPSLEKCTEDLCPAQRSDWCPYLIVISKNSCMQTQSRRWDFSIMRLRRRHHRVKVKNVTKRQNREWAVSGNTVWKWYRCQVAAKKGGKPSSSGKEAVLCKRNGQESVTG
jgi:hypothetical protein